MVMIQWYQTSLVPRPPGQLSVTCSMEKWGESGIYILSCEHDVLRKVVETNKHSFTHCSTHYSLNAWVWQLPPRLLDTWGDTLPAILFFLQFWTLCAHAHTIKPWRYSWIMWEKIPGPLYFANSYAVVHLGGDRRALAPPWSNLTPPWR